MNYWWVRKELNLQSNATGLQPAGLATCPGCSPKGTRSLERSRPTPCQYIRGQGENGGSGGIRTHGTQWFAGFQDQCLKPLGHTSNLVISPGLEPGTPALGTPCSILLSYETKPGRPPPAGLLLCELAVPVNEVEPALVQFGRWVTDLRRR